MLNQGFHSTEGNVGTFEQFEDIEAWKKARLLLVQVYKVTKKEDFYRDRAMRDQF